MKSYSPQVHGCGDPKGTFTGNGLRFATESEAKRWLDDLGLRWFGFDDSRVIESDDPVTHKIEDNELKRID